MEPQIRFSRHSELWQAGTTRVQRTAVAGLIFASVIFFNVIEPYAKTEQGRSNLLSIQEQQQQAGEELARLDTILMRLEAISTVVEEAAWRRHQQELAKRFRNGTVAAPQQEADLTIRTIAAEIRRDVLGPLAEALAEPGLSVHLADQTAGMQAVIDQWEQSHLGQRWYQTVGEKERTVSELDAEIGTLQQQTQQVLSDLQSSVDAEHKRWQRQRSELAAELEATEEDIERSLDESIPAWAKGLVSVERMINAYPWILVGIAIYLAGSALASERHFHGMANAAGWSQTERSDPLLSSVWTLTWRGAIGTGLTLLCYFAVVAGLAYFLYRSMGSGGDGHPTVWLLQLVLLLVLLIVIATPLRRRLVP